MNEEKKSKEDSVPLYMFTSWGKEEINDFEADGNNLVAVWCKLCSKHIEKIKVDNTLKGGKRKKILWITQRK